MPCQVGWINGGDHSYDLGLLRIWFVSDTFSFLWGCVSTRRSTSRGRRIPLHATGASRNGRRTTGRHTGLSKLPYSSAWRAGFPAYACSARYGARWSVAHSYWPPWHGGVSSSPWMPCHAHDTTHPHIKEKVSETNHIRSNPRS
jgi:hypothetical protein